ATVMTLYPEVQSATVVFLWLKTQTLSDTSYDREDVPGIWQKYIERIRSYQQAHAENKWPATPNKLCARFCPVLFVLTTGRDIKMTTVTFDTLKFANRLKAAGVPDNQAEAFADAFKEAQGEAELATKADIAEIRQEMKALEER